MPIQRFTWRSFVSGLWLKGPRENNPAGTLRRAKGVFPLRSGSARSRSGIVALDKRTAHSLFKISGRRIAGIAAQIWREVAGVFTQLTVGLPTLNGNRLTFVAAPPTTGKPDWTFVAGGVSSPNKMFKINPSTGAAAGLDTARQWGLDPPTGVAPSIASSEAGGDLVSKNIATLDAADFANWTGTSIDDDGTSSPLTLTSDATKKVEGDASIRFTVPKDSVGRLEKTLGGGGDFNLQDFAAPGDSGDEDYIEIYFATARPKHIKSMEITFFVGVAPTDNEADTFTRELTFKVVKRKKRKQLVGLGDFIRQKDQATFLSSGANVQNRDFSVAEFLMEDQIAVVRRIWTRITIPKASFEANGQADPNPGSGKSWANIRGIRIAVETTKQGKSRCWVDRIRMIGGVGMQGDYQYMFTFFNNDTGSRSNPFPTTIDATTGATVFSPVRINNIERRRIRIGTVAGANALPAPADPQVTHIEVWRTVGGGTVFFLAKRVASTQAAPAVSYTDTVADYPGMFSGGGGTVFLQPEELPDDNDRPDDTARDAIFFAGRMWITRTTTSGTQNRAWFSPAGRSEAISSFVEVGTTDEEAQKYAVWNETLFLFTNKGLYRLATTEEPFIFLPVQGAPGTRQPLTVHVTDGGIVYQATDTVRLFDGNTTEPLAEDALAPVFRTIGGVQEAIGFEGIASTYARGEYYISDDTTSLTTFAYSPDGGWRNLGFPCKALFTERDTRVLLASPTLSSGTYIASIEADGSGEQSGEVAQTTVDSGSDLAGTSLTTDFEIETGAPDNLPSAFKGGGVWGIAQRIYILGQTEGQLLSVSLLVDNTVIAVGTVSTSAGVRKQMELGIQRAGWISGVRLSMAGSLISKRIEVSAVELDVYIPPT